MVAEAVAAFVGGCAVLWLVLRPLTRLGPPSPQSFEPVDPEETPRGIALTALKEIEFDRETGKLSDSDYALLKDKYTAAALDSLRQEQASEVSGDVETVIAAKVRALRFASATTPSDTLSLSPDPSRLSDILSSPLICSSCGPRPEPDAVFCSTCGHSLPHRTLCDRCGAALTPGSRFCDGCGRPVAA